jgi:hypothetical protein
MTTFRATQRHRCALPVRGNSAPNADSVLEICQVQLSRTTPISAIPVRSHPSSEGFDWPADQQLWQRGGDGFTDLRLQHGDLGKPRGGSEYAHVFDTIRRLGPFGGLTSCQHVVSGDA